MISLFPVLKRIYFALYAIAVTFLVVGCSVPSPSFSDMSQTYQREIEKFQNNNILLNVVRASRNMPLSFLDIPNVIGTGSFSETVGAAGYLYGSGAGLTGFFSPYTSSMGGSYWSPNLSLSVNRSFNFTLSSLQNAQFEKGFLTKIPLETVNFFTSDQVPRELIFTLLIERIEYNDLNGQKVVLNNNPLGDWVEYQKFQKQLRLMIDGGLTTELVSKQIPISPLMREDQIMKTNQMVEFVKLRDKNMIMQEVQSAGVKYYQMVQILPQARFCFASNNKIDLIKNYFGPDIECSNPLASNVTAPTTLSNAKQASRAKGSIPPKALLITLRSTQDVFEFLGAVLIAETQSKRVVRLKALSDDAVPKQLVDTDREWPLLVANVNAGSDRTLARIDYDGVDYSIPAKDGGYSVGVMNLLSQLVNLLKIPGSIPASPAVLIK